MTSKFDPLANEKAASVLYCILSVYLTKAEGEDVLIGPSNPKLIADKLGIKPPSAMDHLRKLRKINIIKLGEKVGKFQLYEVNWSEIFKQFFKRSYLYLVETGQTIDYGEIGREKKAEQLRNELQNDKEVQELLKLYFVYLGEEFMSVKFPVPTFNKAVEDFEFSIMIHFPQLPENLRTTRLGRLLGRWYDLIHDIGTYTTFAFKDALDEKLKKSPN